MDTKGIEKTKWDAVIVGTGVAGATAAHGLGLAGLKVLVIEKGENDRQAQEVLGRFAETDPRISSGRGDLQIMREWGRSSSIWESQGYRFNPFVGEGVGGSSALYGMVMEPLEEQDLSPKTLYQKPSLPDWPIEFSDLQYQNKQAQNLYQVHGESPLSASPDYSPANKELFQVLQDQGLSPYKLPMACLYKKACMECQGFLCPNSCKQDSYTSCLKPALRNQNVKLLTGCEALQVYWQKDQVKSMDLSYRGRLLRVTADTVILAAGAIRTPLLLQKSNNLSNSSGLVGKNLMRHFIDLYALETGSPVADNELVKQLASRGLQDGDTPLGYLHSFGRLPVYEVLKMELTGFKAGLSKWFLDRALPVVENLFVEKLRKKILLATMIEDFPSTGNLVRLAQSSDPFELHIKYSLSQEDQERVRQTRTKVQEIFSEQSPVLLGEVHNNKRIAHASGTCKMGENPKDSVVDPWNRSHDIKNLYIIDSSFFPTSTRYNPSLTLAPNSLRICQEITKSHLLQDRVGGSESA